MVRFTQICAYLVLFSLVCNAASFGGNPNYNYDHQNTTYTAKHEPLSLKDAELTITPFFSPDHAIDVETDFIDSAKASLDIGIPSFSSWASCTNYYDEKPGCTVYDQRNNETFPLFPAILNALSRGVTVRILTNLFDGEQPAAGLICPFEYLRLAGADVRYFKTVTFLHTKYLQADKKRAIISSINWSRTSIMKNREEGVVVEGQDSGHILDYLRSVFETDYSDAPVWPVLNHYTDADMKIIHDHSHIDVPKPTPWPFPGAYVTGRTPISGKMDITLWTSPDFAWQTLSDHLDETTKSFGLFIYQVTDTELCSKLEHLVTSGLDIKVLVSDDIYDEGDWKRAEKCYEQLAKAGLDFRKTRRQYSYSHCKFWILDDKTVQLSTGNWSPTDYPDRRDVSNPHDYPPYGNEKWVKSNRDYTIGITHPDVVSVFQKVLDEDYERGERWVPE